MKKIRATASHSLPSDTRAAWLMVGPALAGLVLFVAAPFLVALVASFTSYRMGSPLPTEWVGLRNYGKLWTDPSLCRALWNNALFALVVVPCQTALALALAVLVNRAMRGMTFFRTVFFMPVIYPMALVSVVWALIFAPGSTGLANSVLHGLTFGRWSVATDFLSDPSLALPAIMVMSVWQGVGFQMVVMLAGLQAIPGELYEAAAIDSAGPWARFRYVTLPQMRNTILFVGMVTAILAFRLFDQVWILTRGGPNDATTTMLYEAFVAARERNDVGLGSAITVVFFLVVCAVALAQHWMVRQERAVE